MKKQIALATLLLWLATPVAASDPADAVQRALGHIEAQRYSLARAYLEAVVIDPRLTAAQRSKAYYLRGYSYFIERLYVSAAQDYARALEFAPDNDIVLAEVGRMYAQGLGVEKDLRQAFVSMQKSARAGNADAKAYVGYALLTGTGTARDVNKARYWLREAASAGNIDSLLQLALSYRRAFAGVPDPPQALALYHDAAEKGSVDALTALGYMHLNAETGAAEPARAAEYFRQAGERGAPAAQAALAYLYMTGNGVPRDYAAARQWFERATQSQYAGAFVGLAHLHMAGLGVPRDVVQARTLLRQGAELGDAAAQLRIAALELQSPATQARTVDALRWLRAVAARDHPQGRNGLAWVLATSQFANLRDGAAALIEARLATQRLRTANTLDTLAAALAETGDFEQAVATQHQAIALLDANEQTNRDAFDARLRAYGRDEPWRE